ncbi:MAG: hypothetical protein IBJ16_00960 [Chitinophagaceae bacterium]|nr:hypothetical protein [Chitinophagaceae bacterium]
MRNTFFIFSFVLLFSCSEHNNQDPINKESKFSSLLTKYKDISFDTLKIFSSDNTEIETYQYKGVQLDSLDVLLFPESIANRYNPSEVFAACFKFPLDSSRIALITRVPSTYQSSSLQLLIFDRNSDRVTDIIELAEMVGDAGDVYSKHSWLYKTIKEGTQIFGWIQESHDNSVENENDTTIQITNTYYLLSILKDKVDTINQNKELLAKQFESLLRQDVGH